jgi:hypothetical protein
MIMSRKEIIEKLKDLCTEIKDYAKYLENNTYHPYDNVEKFANELKIIINKMEDE